MRKNTYIRLFILPLIALLLVASCKKRETIEYTIYNGYEYFPVTVGSWITYEVDSIYHDDDVSIHDTTHFQLREVVAELFTDNEGRETMRLERFKRANDTLPWGLTDVWFANATETRVEKVEENIRYLRLVFPIKEGKTWDGNVYNTDSERDYEYTTVHQSASINNLPFDSTLQVTQIADSNFVKRQRAIETYATGIGLIYKVYIDLDTDLDFTIQDPGAINTGIEYYQTITGYGN